MSASTNGTFPTDAGSAAAVYAGRGLSVVPNRWRSKTPWDLRANVALAGWESLRITADTLDQYFPPGCQANIGGLNGAASNNQADCDLDCPEALLAAPYFLPASGWVFGRATAPKSHWLYRTDEPLTTAALAFNDLDGSRLLELRGDGGQTVLPPSAHEGTGEIITWSRFTTPAQVALSDLKRVAAELAAAVLLARHWPATGGRQDAFLALVGGLLRAGWDKERTQRFARALAEATGDEEARKRAKTVPQTSKKQDQDRKTTGWPTLQKCLGNDGEEVLRRVRLWLGITVEATAGTKKPARYRPLATFVPFPLHTLAPVLSELTATSAQSIGCDPALVAGPVLALAAGCVGNSRTVVLKKGWAEPCVIWSVTVADSGGHKSPAYHHAIDPLMELQMDLFDRHKEAMDAYKDEVDDWQQKPKDERGDKPQEPPEPQTFITSDTTIEALGELLQDNMHGMLLARDELDAWFKSFTRYKGKGGGTDRPQWLELHRAGTLRIDRLTRDRPRLAVRRAAVSLTGTIQPSVLRDALDVDALQSGLGARFLLVMPPDRRRVWTEAELPEELVARYQGLLLALLELSLADATRRRPFALGLAEPAKRLWVDFYNEWGGVQYASEGEQRAAFAKIEAYAPRLMLLHHVVAHVAAGADDRCAVTETSARAGIELARWFAAESVRIYAMLRESEEERHLRRLVEWLAGRGGRAAVRDLQRANSRRWPTSDLAEAALQELVEAGLGRWEEGAVPEGGGHRLRQFILQLPTPDTSDTPSGVADAVIVRAPDTRTDTRPFELAARGSGAGVTCGGNYACEAQAEHPPGGLSEVSGAVSSLSSPQAVNTGGPVSEASVGQVPAGPGCRNAEAGPFLLVREAAALPGVIAAIDNSARVGLDTETTGLDPRKDRLRLLALDCETVDGGRYTYLVDCFGVDPAPLWEVLAEKEIVAHNAAFDLQFLAGRGFTAPGKVFDTMLAAQVLTAGTGERVTLAACCVRWLNTTVDKSEQQGDWSGDLTAEQLAYAAIDVQVLVPLADAQGQVAQADGLAAAVEIEQRCLPAVVWLSRCGVALDRAAWEGLAEQARAEAAELRRELDRLAPIPADVNLFGATWNWDSATQVKQALALAGCQVANTRAATLAAADHPLAQLLRRYRLAAKRGGGFGTAWLEHVTADGRVYPSWWQIGASSGRMSCSSPNMQQMPRGPYRRCVTAPPDRVLVKADFSQIELRIAAKVSGDAGLLEAYQRGEDLHQRTARSVLGVQEVTKQQRQLAKALNFGLLYGMGAEGFRRYARAQYGVLLSAEEAARYRAAFFKTYPGLRVWHRRVGRSGDEAVETRTLTGRRQRDVRRFNEKLNLPVQGTGADGLKLALAFVWERRDQCPGAFPVMAVHDEIVVEAPRERAEEAAAWVRQAMLDAMAPLLDPVPVEVEVKVGRTWAGD